MDVNNTPYFLLREESEFSHNSSHFTWHAGRGALTLTQQQSLRLPDSNPEAALGQWQASRPLVLDLFGQIGRIDPSGQYLQYNAGRGFLNLQDAELQNLQAPAGEFIDLTLGGDGRMAALFSDTAEDHGLVLFHLGRRWQTQLALPEQPLRAAIDEENRVWIISANSLMLCEGEPLPLPYEPQTDRFEPTSTNPHPLHLLWSKALPEGLQALAICVDKDHVFILAYDADNNQQILVRPRTKEGARDFLNYPLNEGVPFAIDLAIVAADRLAALVPREPTDIDFTQCDAVILHLDRDEASDTGEAKLVRERYPMLSQAQPQFVSSLDDQLRYQANADPEFPDFTPRPRELHPLLRPRYPKHAEVSLLRSLDSGRPDTTWHRIYLEACIPAGTKLTISVRSYNDPDEREDLPYLEQVQPLWNSIASELPFQEGLIESKEQTSGLFEILPQRPEGNVRRINGRYLQLRIRMQGDGLRTPAIHAIRVYYPRFSYQESYLPEHFHQEEIYQQPESGTLPANGADMRERFFAALEGVLTPVEARIASAEALASPDATPAENLPWLGEMVGMKLPDYWPVSRHRRLIRNTGVLQRYRGTLRGIRMALDIATEGKVARGEIVIVENFLLRRTMSTILGINMDDHDHPLTLGTGMSGNSIVGDSLILSEQDARTFLSLFSPELATEDEKEVIEEFFNRYSNQVSVLLHGKAREERNLVNEILEENMPTHVQWKIIETDHPFVLGLAPLLEVDTYLETSQPPRRVTLNDSYLGKEGLLINPLALSPRDVNARPSAS